MKKSSRDYRRNRRKKWVKINLIHAKASLNILHGLFEVAQIQSDIRINPHVRAVLTAQAMIKTAYNIADVFNDPIQIERHPEFFNLIDKTQAPSPGQSWLSEQLKHSQAQ